jgi:phenylpyruvate tautomerase
MRFGGERVLLFPLVAFLIAQMHQVNAFMAYRPISLTTHVDSTPHARSFARTSVVVKPTLIVHHTGGELPADEKAAFLAEASKTISVTLGKAESYVMVSVCPSSMSFAGQPGNAAFLYLASIGHIGPETNKPAAKELTALVEKHMGIPANRVFIQFSDAAAANFAWQGNTFG